MCGVGSGHPYWVFTVLLQVLSSMQNLGADLNFWPSMQILFKITVWMTAVKGIYT